MRKTGAGKLRSVRAPVVKASTNKERGKKMRAKFWKETFRSIYPFHPEAFHPYIGVSEVIAEGSWRSRTPFTPTRTGSHGKVLNRKVTRSSIDPINEKWWLVLTFCQDQLYNWTTKSWNARERYVGLRKIQNMIRCIQ